MTKRNYLDLARASMAAEYTKMREALKNDLKGVPPYNSVKLSDAEEQLLYDHPERILPGGVGDPAQARQALKENMGPKGYADFIKRRNGL